MIGRDISIFKPASAVRSRLVKLAAQVGEITDLAFSKLTEEGAEVKDGALTILPTQSRRAAWYVVDAYKIFKKITKPDLITVQDPFLAGLAGVWAKRFYRVPLEIQVHTDVLAKNFRYLSIKNFSYYLLARFILPRANKVRVVSERVKRELVKSKLVAESKIYVLPIFATLNKISGAPSWFTQVPAGRKIILMAGRLEAEKRYSLALQALAKLADKKVMLVVAGAGSLLVDLQAEAVRLGIDKQVLWLGQLDPEELVQSYEVSHFFLHTAAYEGYGLVFAEAAQAGLPIISTDVGVAKEAGALIVAPTALAIAMGLTAALKNPPHSHLPPLATEDDYLTTLTREWQALLS